MQCVGWSPQFRPLRCFSIPGDLLPPLIGQHRLASELSRQAPALGHHTLTFLPGQHVNPN
jgi:hypothetical protein